MASTRRKLTRGFLFLMAVLSVVTVVLFSIIWVFSGSGRAVSTKVEVSEMLPSEARDNYVVNVKSEYQEFCSGKTLSTCDFWKFIRFSENERGTFVWITTYPSVLLKLQFAPSMQHLAAEEAMFDLFRGKVLAIERDYRWTTP